MRAFALCGPATQAVRVDETLGLSALRVKRTRKIVYINLRAHV